MKHDADPRWVFQRRAVAEAKRRNLLVVAHTNSGKTIIAAELIHRTLPDAVADKKKIIFLAPSVSLVDQQVRVLEDHVGSLEIRRMSTSDVLQPLNTGMALASPGLVAWTAGGPEWSTHTAP